MTTLSLIFHNQGWAALPVGLPAALTPLLVFRQTLGYHSGDRLGDVEFQSDPLSQSPYGFFRDVRVALPASEVEASFVVSGCCDALAFSGFLSRSVEGGEDVVWLS